MSEIVLPSNRESEVYALGAVFHSQYAADKVFTSLKREDFWFSENREIFSVLQKAYQLSMPMSEQYLIQELRKEDKLEMCGGIEGIAATILHGLSVDIDRYCDIIIEMSHRRQAIRLMEAAMKNLSDTKSNYSDLFSVVMKKLSCLSGANLDEFKSLREIVRSFKEGKSLLQYMEEKRSSYQNGDQVFEGIKTGFPNLDSIIGGMGNGHNIIIGARSGTGKTTFLINLIKQISENHPDKRMAFFSLEMSKESIAEKIACTMACVDPRKYHSFSFSDHEAERLKEALKIMEKWNLILYPYSSCNINDFRNSIRREIRNDGVDIVLTDYLTRIKANNKYSNKHLEIDEISKGLQDAALELNIPLVTLAQLNRNIFNRQDKRPVIADLRESGSIEEDSDTILLLHRPKNYDENLPVDVLEVIVAKNRHLGKLGRVTMEYESGRYFESEDIEDLIVKAKNYNKY